MATGTVLAPGAIEEGQAPAHRPAHAARPAKLRRSDILIITGYLLGSLFLLVHVLRDPTARVEANNVNDNAFFEWALAHGARVITHGVNPFVSAQMNGPAGVNLMANTSILGLSIPLAPITLLLGPGVSYLVLLVLGLAGTAAAWYYVLDRHLVRSRTGAVLGGAFCGFGPGMVAHANGHPNLVAQFLVPFIVWHCVRLGSPHRVLRRGIGLGLLVTWQALINEEILFVIALGFTLFVAGYAVQRRSRLRGALRPALRGLLVAALVAGPLLGYPLAVQFFGPQTYHGLGASVRNFGADVTSFAALPSQSLGGSGFTRWRYAQNPAEENSFFGWPLLVLLCMLGYWLRRSPAVRALAGVAVLFGVMSLGPRLYVHGRHTHIPGPFRLLNWLPLFDSMVPTRLALAIVPVIGILLAYGCQRAGAALRDAAQPARLAWYALLVAALLPLVPRPLPAIDTTPVPRFVSSGAWRRYVPPGSNLVSVPLAGSRYVQPLFWSAYTGLDLPVARGYFLGPASATGGGPREAIFGAPPRPTSTLLEQVLAKGKVPLIAPADRAAARADLSYWRASVVVLQPRVRNEVALWEATSELLGFEPTWLDGVWMWDLRVSDA